MKKGFIVILVIAAVVIISFVVVGIIFLSDYAKKPTVDSCVELGCPTDTLYVGSINSDKYYECSCGWAKNINFVNIVCFSSEQEAEDKNYTKSEC